MTTHQAQMASSACSPRLDADSSSALVGNSKWSRFLPVPDTQLLRVEEFLPQVPCLVSLTYCELQAHAVQRSVTHLSKGQLLLAKPSRPAGQPVEPGDTIPNHCIAPAPALGAGRAKLLLSSSGGKVTLLDHHAATATVSACGGCCCRSKLEVELSQRFPSVKSGRLLLKTARRPLRP